MHTMGFMTLVQIRDVDSDTVAALKDQARERGLTLAAYLRAELERLAQRPTNEQIVARLRQRDRTDGPSTAATVAEIRRARESA